MAISSWNPNECCQTKDFEIKKKKKKIDAKFYDNYNVDNNDTVNKISNHSLFSWLCKKHDLEYRTIWRKMKPQELNKKEEKKCDEQTNKQYQQSIVSRINNINKVLQSM